MSTRQRRERGQTSLMIVGFFLVGVLMVAVVVDASAAHLFRQRLDALADGAALAATEGMAVERLYTDGIGAGVELDPARARGYARDYLRATGALGRHPGLTLEVRTLGDLVQVRVAAPLELPLVPPGWADGTSVSSTAAAQVDVTG